MASSLGYLNAVGVDGVVSGWAAPLRPGVPANVTVCVNRTMWTSIEASAGANGTSFRVAVPIGWTGPLPPLDVPSTRIDVISASSAPDPSACGSTEGLALSLDASPRYVAELSANLTFPGGLQGQDDHLAPWVLNQPEADGGGLSGLRKRYSETQRLFAPGVRRYNFFWEGIEPVPPADTLIGAAPCPKGHVRVPTSEAQRAELGFHRFHCYSAAAMQRQDVMAALDRSIGALTGLILYASPAWARHPGCTGFPWKNATLPIGCLPTPAHMPDWEDFINAVAWRYNGAPLSHFSRAGLQPPLHPAVANGSLPVPNKLSLAIVWNEIGSLGWADPSPVLPNRWDGPGGNLTDEQVGALAAVHAELLSRAHAALRRQLVGVLCRPPAGAAGTGADGGAALGGAMVLVSIDHFWWFKGAGHAPFARPGVVGHVGDQRLLSAIWPRLEPGLSWGVAVHPYDAGDPRADMTAGGVFTFATLKRVVIAFQEQQLAALGGVPPQGLVARPQRLLWASEQGWRLQPPRMNQTIRARNVCFAQALSEAQGLVSVTHNYFQAEPTAPEVGNFGLVPAPPAVGPAFQNGTGHPTFDAYVATSLPSWRVDPSNWCCANYAVGCPGA